MVVWKFPWESFEGSCRVVGKTMCDKMTHVVSGISNIGRVSADVAEPSGSDGQPFGGPRNRSYLNSAHVEI